MAKVKYCRLCKKAYKKGGESLCPSCLWEEYEKRLPLNQESIKIKEYRLDKGSQPKPIFDPKVDLNQI